MCWGEPFKPRTPTQEKRMYPLGTVFRITRETRRTWGAFRYVVHVPGGFFRMTFPTLAQAGAWCDDNVETA